MRRPGSLGSIALLLGLELALCRAQVNTQYCGAQDQVEKLHFTSLGRGRWLDPQGRPPGSLAPLYRMVRGFLDVVQLNPFPEGLVRVALNEPSSVRTSDVVRYEAGYVVCAVIALLFLLIVPTVGFCFCCCRFRRRCGGRVKAEHKSMACERGSLMTFLLLITLFLLTGVVCAFITNQRTHDEVGPGVRAVPSVLNSLQGLVSDIPQELQAVAEQFSIPQTLVLEDLDDFGVNIGSTIHTQLRGTVYPMLTSLQRLGQDLKVSLDHLQRLNSSTVYLQNGQEPLAFSLRDHRHNLLFLLQNVQCQGCANALDLAKLLELGANFSQLPAVTDVLQKLQGVPEANFSTMVLKDNSTFNTLPFLTALETTDTVQDLKEEMAKIPEEVKSLAKGFPGSGAADRWRQALAQAENTSRPYLHAIQKYERYRWIAGYVLSSVILLVVICNLLGLSLGLLGISAREDSSHMEIKGEAGAQFLMAGVGLSFLFSGPFILLIFATFLVGGNIQTLVCRSWESQELYQFADTPGNLPPSMNLSHLLGLKKDISILSAYQQCKEGVPLWEVLQLNGSYDPEKHLDISKYTVQMQEELRNFQVDMQNLDLLTEAAKRDLEAFRHSGIEKIDYPSFVAQVQKPLVKIDILKLIKELEQLGQAQSNPDLGQRLTQEAWALQAHYEEMIIFMQTHMVMLNQSVHALSSSASRLQLLASETLVKANSLKTDLPTWIEQIFKNESECFLNRETAYFTQYVDWARQMVTEHIATCQPLSEALDNGRVILCDHIANPWNAFWFCLAWCTFLLIPSIIFAIKTTKHFRPIRKRLSSTSSEETQLFHIPRVTSLKL
ncbi:prominin-2 isoform X1 [Monodelphis domestica]|uniref:prominin-2 isoform X1 n=1 Tax=Monodelphis domestica TaxID=13616 RepID=UPI0024E1E810|nr:prominin-2 isoform X1 [Monodelphis domestica]